MEARGQPKTAVSRYGQEQRWAVINSTSQGIFQPLTSTRGSIWARRHGNFSSTAFGHLKFNPVASVTAGVRIETETLENRAEHAPNRLKMKINIIVKKKKKEAPL